MIGYNSPQVECMQGTKENMDNDMDSPQDLSVLNLHTEEGDTSPKHIVCKDEDSSSTERGNTKQLKHSSESNLNLARKIAKYGGDTEVRMLIPCMVARAIIGKGGHNIARLRSEHRGIISVPDSPGPERILTLSSDKYTVLKIVKNVLPYIKDLSSRSLSRNDDVEIRMLIHQSLVGSVIGKSGTKIQKIQDITRSRVKILGKCCPKSTDRVCLIYGSSTACLDALADIIDLIKSWPIKGENMPYDPSNYDTHLFQEYGGYEPDNKSRIGTTKHREADDRTNSSSESSGIKREADNESGPPSKRSRVGGDTEIRLLVPSRVARGIIGRGGNNIRKLRSEYLGFITVPDCPGPERVVTISSDLLSALQIVLGIVPFIEEANRSGSRTDDVQLRVLVHQSLAGSIIGKSGSRIQKLEELSGARVKLFSKCCPQSTDRICQVWGRPKSCVKALKEIIEIIKNGPYIDSITPYDPHNFDIESIEDYGGYRDQESKLQEKKHFSGSDGSPPRKVNDDPVHQTDDDSGSKQESECGKNAFPKYVQSEKDKYIRFLIPSKTARAIIGKGGFNIKKLRREYRAIITIRDCPGPERILAITSDMDVIQQILHSILPTLEEASSNDDVDLRLLIHRSQAGSIIGKSGSKIQKLQENTGARVKLFPVCCPQSSERVCQIIGKRNAPVECFKEIIELLEGSPPKGHPIPYDPHNFDDYSAQDYGGFSESNKIRGSSVRDILKDERSRSTSRGRSSSPLSQRSHSGRSDDVRIFGRACTSHGPVQNNELLKLLAQQEAEIQSLKKRILLTGI